MSNILVTGGAGYIGSHACKQLSKDGYTPITFDNLSTGWLDAVKYGPFVKGDLMKKSDLDEVFMQYKPIAVMHFGAFSQVGESIENPGKYWRNNVLGSLNLIEKSLEYECNNIVFSSTCATYGDQDNVVLNEEAKQSPINSYGSSKRAVEEILINFERSSNLKSVIFRYFNVAGADQEAEIGEFHKPETHLIPIILDTISNKEKILTLHGTDYDTDDGTCIRDYVHVCDLVDAHILGLKWLLDGSPSRVYNLGTGRGFSVHEVIKRVEYLTNKSVKIIKGPRRKGDCKKLVSGSARAFEELGWRADRSNLDQMILDAWRWKENGTYLM
jgi:UDP-glucose 4-epimerase